MPLDLAGDLATFFDAGEFAKAATYTPPAGAPAAVTVILDRPDSVADLGRLDVLAAEAVALVRASEIAAPQRDATLVVGTATYKVMTFRKSLDELLWSLDLALQ